MKKNQLKNIIKYVEINGGATLKPNGDLLALNSGFMVSLAGYEKKITLKKLNVNDINNYLNTAKKFKAYCGLWLENGSLYIDISIRVNNKALALSLGRKNHQLAVYDLKENQSIYIN